MRRPGPAALKQAPDAADTRGDAGLRPPRAVDEQGRLALALLAAFAPLALPTCASTGAGTPRAAGEFLRKGTAVPAPGEEILAAVGEQKSPGNGRLLRWVKSRGGRIQAALLDLAVEGAGRIEQALGFPTAQAAWAR